MNDGKYNHKSMKFKSICKIKLNENLYKVFPFFFFVKNHKKKVLND